MRVVINEAQAFRIPRTASEKMIRRFLLDLKLEAFTKLANSPYGSGRLAASLHEKVSFTARGVEGELGSDLPYAASVNDGAQAHYIFPNPPKTHLKFFWRKRGRVVTPPFVYHPGQKGKGFLTEPLERVGRRYNMLVFVYKR